MEYGVDNNIWDGVITLKIVLVEIQSKISTSCNTLCQLNKCSASLEINEKMGENVESH
jgi:hypothetical protein